jgi:hypothetical protein
VWLVGLRGVGTGRQAGTSHQWCCPRRKDRLGWDGGAMVTEPQLPPRSKKVITPQPKEAMTTSSYNWSFAHSIQPTGNLPGVAVSGVQGSAQSGRTMTAPLTRTGRPESLLTSIGEPIVHFTSRLLTAGRRDEVECRSFVHSLLPPAFVHAMVFAENRSSMPGNTARGSIIEVRFGTQRLTWSVAVGGLCPATCRKISPYRTTDCSIDRHRSSRDPLGHPRSLLYLQFSDPPVYRSRAIVGYHTHLEWNATLLNLVPKASSASENFDSFSISV